MPAMTMSFKLRPGEATDGLASGCEIRATLAVTDSESWLEHVRVVRRGAPVVLPATPPPAATPGTLVPDFALVNQDGQPIHVGGYRGRVLLVTFMYTRCPLPEFCPRVMHGLQRIERALRDKRLHEHVHLLAVSFDPERDTPAVLRAYGRLYAEAQDPAPFQLRELATGSARTIREMADFFGVSYEAEADGTISHSLMTAVVDADGKLATLYAGNTWQPEDVLAEVERHLARPAAGRE